MALKKPKAKKFPKAPKANAGAEVWRRHAEKCAAIKKDNEAALSQYEKDVKSREASKKKAQQIKSK